MPVLNTFVTELWGRRWGRFHHRCIDTNGGSPSCFVGEDVVGGRATFQRPLNGEAMRKLWDWKQYRRYCVKIFMWKLLFRAKLLLCQANEAALTGQAAGRSRARSLPEGGAAAIERRGLNPARPELPPRAGGGRSGRCSAALARTPRSARLGGAGGGSRESRGAGPNMAEGKGGSPGERSGGAAVAGRSGSAAGWVASALVGGRGQSLCGADSAVLCPLRVEWGGAGWGSIGRAACLPLRWMWNGGGVGAGVWEGLCGPVRCRGLWGGAAPGARRGCVGESSVPTGQGWGALRGRAAAPALRCWDPSGTFVLHLQDPWTALVWLRGSQL